MATFQMNGKTIERVTCICVGSFVLLRQKRMRRNVVKMAIICNKGINITRAYTIRI